MHRYPNDHRRRTSGRAARLRGSLAALAFGLGALILAPSASAEVYQVEWEGSDFGYIPPGDAPPPFSPLSPFDTISGSFTIDLVPGDPVDPTSAGLSAFEASFPIGSDIIYQVIPGGLALGGSDEGIGNFGTDDLFLYIFDFFGDPVIAGLGFSADGNIFGARDTSVSVVEVVGQPVPPVPLPAAGLLLVAALGGLGAARARARRHAAA